MAARTPRHQRCGIHPDALFTVLAFLLGIEAMSMFGILNEWPVLGEYYEGYSGPLSVAAFAVSCLTLAAWYWVNRPRDDGALGHPGRARLTIPLRLVWCVLLANAIATFTFGYGSVGYSGAVPFAFLLTALPLEPLLIARVAQRGRIDPGPMLAYAALGVARGWTGHLFFIFLIYLLTSNTQRRRTALIVVLVAGFAIFEPLMQLRALIRGFDDASGLLVYRLASRLAFTPISDYVLGNIAPVAFCGGSDYMPWYQELIFSVIPRAIFGIEGNGTVHNCLAVMASGNQDTELSFSTTLSIKAALIFMQGPGSFLAFLVCICGCLYLQVKLARRLLGPAWYVYTGIYQYQFFLSGVLRDLAIPTYLLVVMLLFQWTGRRKQRNSSASLVLAPGSLRSAQE